MSKSRESPDEVEAVDPWWSGEFSCWTMVVLAPFLTWVNGPSVSTDQFVVRTAVFCLALSGGIGLRIANVVRRRGEERKGEQADKETGRQGEPSVTDFGRARWTLRDAVVATVVVAVLASLVFMALPLARERARRGQCQENLRQIGLGLQSYHQADGMLPPAAIREGPTITVPLMSASSQDRLVSAQCVWAV